LPQSPMPTLQSEIPTDETTLRQPVERVLQQAIDHHRAGSLLEAERCYRAILSQWPDHADANHNLGVLTVATGHGAAALPYFQAAIRANPGQGQFWLSCIDALIQIGHAEAARQMMDIGVQSGLRGDVVQTLRDRLERIASEAPSAGSVAAPIPALDAESSDRPERTPAGGKGARGRRAAQSTKNGQKKASFNSDVPEPAEAAWLLSLFEQGREQEMENLARSFTERYPKSGYGWNMLGALRQRKSNFSDAATCYRRALEADPDCVEACFNLGRILQEHGDLTKAEGCYRRAVELYPGFLAAHYGLGEVFDLQGRFAESEACYRRVIEIQPDLAKAHNNLAVALTRQERPAESEASSRQALELTPRFAEAFCNLGASLQDQGRLAEAADSYRDALEIRPDLPVAHHGLLFCLSHSDGIEPEALFAEHLRFAERFEAPLRSAWPRHQNSREPNRHLKIGFVSGDLRQHALAYFIEPLFSHLAGDDGLSIHVYSNHAAEDTVTERLRGHVPHWNRIFALSDDALAAKISADGIDIVVDLTGHTARNRLLAFARKPAPVQCGWIGYLGTSGLRSIDYYLADRDFLPPGEFDRYFTEKIVYLPAVAPFQPNPDAPAVNPLPALESGHLTFGSFSRLSKLSRPVIALWSQLLRGLPESQMLIAGMPRDGRYESLSGWFHDEGIAPERLQFHPRCDSRSYFELHHQVDLCLDPFPFTGATTTSHALWMGVPTLTLTGQTVPGRLGPVLLHHAGLGDFVARNPQEFVEKGFCWARNLESLARLRAGLRERFLQSPIGQPSIVAQGLSVAFRQMWRSWCAATSEPETGIPSNERLR
jgi:protein O-GlcNAc transferase